MEQATENEGSEVRKELSKKDVAKSFWRWTFFSHANYNYERLEATGLVHAFSPIIKKLYADNPEEYRNALKRHMAFFNTEPHFGGVICGMVIAMEEDRANGAPITDDAINGIKTGLMGPFAGIGDTLWQGTLTPILLAFGVSLGSEGNLMGPLVYGLMMFGIMFSLAYFVWMQGYRMGKTGIEKILSSNILQYLITGASAMGAIVLGALTANFVSVSSPFVIKVGTVELGLQEDILDKLFKGILPLGITLLTLYLLKNRKMKSTTVMLILVVIGVVFGAANIF
ncbi:PTS system mannose/fructose/sorbose family transporter subunit IID [Enterococcus sp. BWB1-3]|uniref:PTS system mannose/fructose/sorbose family transporter subunit IID n=1 Tax=Enterococcus sp. BWB1-3 TaxID=2787713 RepID=UPI0019241B79|nr:PTS system mannose/fructose/sorbose family transporter subunit IID [Enterococcus sp. BWB1-3]MBL1229684.1 PTS system mannose/fructose/sorbose family transporter subunit IID [Enterococcus sp. BWB1-3]